MLETLPEKSARSVIQPLPFRSSNQAPPRPLATHETVEPPQTANEEEEELRVVETASRCGGLLCRSQASALRKEATQLQSRGMFSYLRNFCDREALHQVQLIPGSEQALERPAWINLRERL